jgi:hypothetical protein
MQPHANTFDGSKFLSRRNDSLQSPCSKTRAEQQIDARRFGMKRLLSLCAEYNNAAALHEPQLHARFFILKRKASRAIARCLFKEERGANKRRQVLQTPASRWHLIWQYTRYGLEF